METFIGLKSLQFERVFASVSRSLLVLYKDLGKARTSLYIYLMKLKTNHTNKQIGVHFQLTSRTISDRIKKVRKIVHRDFASNHLFKRSRRELLENTTELSRALYEKSNDAAVCIWDATYVYTIKSSNYQFQKDSYSGQKKRNLLKVMLCVMPNGLIAGAYGPYSAKKNDATILNELIDKQQSIFSNFLPGDVMVLDRGFRDSVRKLKSSGFDVKIPKCTEHKTNSQLSTREANDSRIVTKIRFMIEVRNSHIKNKWKFLCAVKNVESLPTLMEDFEVCTSFINAFCDTFECDKNDSEMIGRQMLLRRNIPNSLSNWVGRIHHSSFERLDNLTLFPKLTFADLKYISLGTYQIEQARSYCQVHLRANQNKFVVFQCNDAVCRQICEKIAAKTTKPVLIYVKLKSRFQSTKHHNTYVLFDLGAEGKNVVIAYCCSCKNGKRTIGCCSHVMTVIWYTYHIDHNNLKFPSPQLDTVFHQDYDSDSDSDRLSDSE